MLTLILKTIIEQQNGQTNGDPNAISNQIDSFPRRINFDSLKDDERDFMKIPWGNCTSNDLKKTFKSLYKIINKLRYTPINVMFLNKKSRYRWGYSDNCEDPVNENKSFDKAWSNFIKDYNDNEIQSESTWESPHGYNRGNIMAEYDYPVEKFCRVYHWSGLNQYYTISYTHKIVSVIPYCSEGLRPRLIEVAFTYPYPYENEQYKTKFWSGNLDFKEGINFKDLGIMVPGKEYFIGPNTFELPNKSDIPIPGVGQNMYYRL